MARVATSSVPLDYGDAAGITPQGSVRNAIAEATGDFAYQSSEASNSKTASRSSKCRLTTPPDRTSSPNLLHNPAAIGYNFSRLLRWLRLLRLILTALPEHPPPTAKSVAA